MGYVYCLHDFTNNICRIGKTKAHKAGRIRSQTGYYPFELTPVSVYFIDESAAEKHFHKTFKSKNVRADWFKITPDDFDEEVRKYKLIVGEVVASRPIGVQSNGTIKYWRVLSESVEHKCDFVHINIGDGLLKLKCKDKFVSLQLEGAHGYRIAKDGNWVKAFASRKNSFKFVKVRFK
jgi:hypothetical protein